MSIASEISRINQAKTDIKNAIENKGVTVGNGTIDTYASKISQIDGGGGSVVLEEKDINFYDYDGTLLYSYTLQEFQSVTELPALPTQQGLICQGWNWTLQDIKNEGKATDVGATYITDDGKTRLYIHIETNGEISVPICFKQSEENGVKIDWGDESLIETYAGSGTTYIQPTHTYSSTGNYIITLTPSLTCTLTLGCEKNNTYGTTYGIMGTYNVSTRRYSSMLRKLEIGNNVTNIGAYAFQYCYNLKNITIPNNVTNIGEDAFTFCYSLANIVIPNSITQIYTYTFSTCFLQNIEFPNTIINIENHAIYNCYFITKITIPNSVTTFADYAIYNCYKLKKSTISNNVTTISTYTYYNCCLLANLKMPDSITSIGNAAFSGCYSLTNIKIPHSVAKIDNYAFSDCISMNCYDFSNHTSVPTLGGTNAFRNIPDNCKIIVPDNLYTSWIAATNWSTLKTHIVKASEVS